MTSLRSHPTFRHRVWSITSILLLIGLAAGVMMYFFDFMDGVAFATITILIGTVVLWPWLYRAFLSCPECGRRLRGVSLGGDRHDAISRCESCDIDWDLGISFDHDGGD